MGAQSWLVGIAVIATCFGCGDGEGGGAGGGTSSQSGTGGSPPDDGRLRPPPNGVAIAYGYDNAGRLATVSFPVTGGTRTITYGRDGAAAVSSITDSDSVDVGYGYDAFGRVTTHTDSGAGDGRSLAYAYDKRGLRTKMTLSGAGGFHVD